MLSPLAVQVAVVLLVVLSVGGILTAALYPRLAGGTQGDKRMEAIATPRRKAAERLANADENRRKRSVEDTLKELEEAQKTKARRSQRPTLTTRMRQAGLGWSKTVYYLVCLASAFLSFAFALLVFRLGLIPCIGFAISGGL
ncbi:MAG TPA: hypothetical protein VG106_14275, partial [Vicinamibacterales bacterium]|nr:hypothetical protein [Vicinamibacterales bacterium]